MGDAAALRAVTNLNVLKRMDPCINQVLDNGSHAVVYTFQEASKSWQKENCEGSLFVVQRSQAPFHQVVLLNRRGTDNLVEDISTPDFSIQDQDPYLIYRNSAKKIVGLWFYDTAERARICQLLQSITAMYKSQRASTTPAAVQAPTSAGNTGDVASSLKNLLRIGPGAPAAAQQAPPPSAGGEGVLSGSPSDANAFLKSLSKGGGIAAAAAPPVASAGGKTLLLSKSELQHKLVALVNNPAFIDAVYAEYVAEASK